MQAKNILIIVIVVIGAIALIIFLIRKNRNDIITLNPDAEDAVEETHEDEIRKKEKN